MNMCLESAAAQTKHTGAEDRISQFPLESLAQREYDSFCLEPIPQERATAFLI
jgi:hypothetical protein